MSFDAKYQSRFEDVISPAITSLSTKGTSLVPNRVDLSRSGDSILTDINDGIAHATLVLADVSSIGTDADTKYPYRNSNVLYEVGIALASRQTHEVLLIRDDDDKFLFDVSTIPHATLDFESGDESIKALATLLQDRLDQKDFVNDARVQLALSRLSGAELHIIRQVGESKPGTGWGFHNEQGITQWVYGIPRLLENGIIQLNGEFDEGYPCYKYTELGLIVSSTVLNNFPQHKGMQRRDREEQPEEPRDEASGA